MVIQRMRFNIYLLCLVLLAAAAGCRSPEARREKQLATLRVHLEAGADSGGMHDLVPIYRASPTMVKVDRRALLTELDVAEAKVVVDSLGGFYLRIQFSLRGTWLLEQYSAVNPGKRFAVYTDFGEKLTEHRWLGAPVVARRISDGVLAFTPDATREEAEEIARGLNNAAIKSGNQAKPKKSKAK